MNNCYILHRKDSYYNVDDVLIEHDINLGVFTDDSIAVSYFKEYYTQVIKHIKKFISIELKSAYDNTQLKLNEYSNLVIELVEDFKNHIVTTKDIAEKYSDLLIKLKETTQKLKNQSVWKSELDMYDHYKSFKSYSCGISKLNEHLELQRFYVEVANLNPVYIKN